MIAYTTLGTNNLEKAGQFYDSLFADLGAQRIMADDHIIIWGTPNSNLTGLFSVVTPFNEEPATVGNGTMVAIHAGSVEMVSKLYEKALSLGCSDEGAPGPRGDNNVMYFSYVRDPEGNKLAFFHMNQGG